MLLPVRSDCRSSGIGASRGPQGEPMTEPPAPEHRFRHHRAGRRRGGRGWLATAALLLPAYGWLTLAVFLPLLTMLGFSFLKVAPFGNRRRSSAPSSTTWPSSSGPICVDVAWTLAVDRLLDHRRSAPLLGLPAALALARATAAARGRCCSS